MEVVDKAAFEKLEREVHQLRIAVAGLTETVDRHEGETGMLRRPSYAPFEPRIDPSPGLERLHLEREIVAIRDRNREVADAVRKDRDRENLSREAEAMKTVSARAMLDLGPQDDQQAAMLRKLRAEGPFKVSPYDRAVIVTDGGRMICAVYNHDERDAVVALLNAR